MGNKDACDILQQDPVGLQVANAERKVVPELAVLAEDARTLSRHGVIGTRESRKESSHAATIEFAREGSHVTPDRSRLQRSFLNPCSQNFGCFDVDLDIAETLSVRDSDSKSEIEASGAREETEVGR